MRIESVVPRAVGWVAAATILVAAACSGCSPANGSTDGELTNASFTKVSFIGVQ
jgi:hypothetical protein